MNTEQPVNDSQNDYFIRIQRLYLKDLSFEAPSSPGIFLQPWDGSAHFNLDVKTKTLDHEHHEVSLDAQVQIQAGDTVAFIIEVEYAGVFEIRVPDNDLDGILHVGCASVLLPYVREIVSSISVKGGFPPFVIDPIDMRALYMEKKSKK